MLGSLVPPRRTNEVVVVGSLMSDLVVYCENLPVSGETVLGTSFSKNYGGKGANQAAMATRLGVRTSMCGMVGADAFGDDYMQELKRQGCHVDNMLQTRDASTGVASITVDGRGSNCIVIVPGANNCLSEENIISFRHIIESSSVLLCQNEIVFARTLQALKLARACGCVSIFNPAPATAECRDAIPFANIVCPNETELSTLTGLPTTTEAEIVAAASALLELGQGECEIVLVSLGSRGACVVRHGEGPHFITAPLVNATDTVGAGDCFIGSFAGYLCRGVPLLEAVANAVQCASISVTRKGAQVSYPNCSELEAAHLQPPDRK